MCESEMEPIIDGVSQNLQTVSDWGSYRFREISLFEGHVLSQKHIVCIIEFGTFCCASLCNSGTFVSWAPKLRQGRQREFSALAARDLTVLGLTQRHHFLCLPDLSSGPPTCGLIKITIMRAFVLLLLATCFSLCVAGGPETLGPLSSVPDAFIKTDGCTVTASSLSCGKGGR